MKLAGDKGPREERRHAYLRYSDVFEYMTYSNDLPTTVPFPTFIAFRTRADGPMEASYTDPRPSFAILETPEEIAAWHGVFNGPIGYEEDRSIVDAELKMKAMVQFHRPKARTYELVSEKPLLWWNSQPSQLPDTSVFLSGVLCRPEDSDGDWPPLLADMGPPGFSDHAARGRYGFEQPALDL